MSEPLRLDPGARGLAGTVPHVTTWPLRIADAYEPTVDLFLWTCPACNIPFNRLSADGLVPNPGQAKALCDRCKAAAAKEES